jgi:putative nucleotidyltransferase with HDIG domain
MSMSHTYWTTDSEPVATIGGPGKDSSEAPWQHDSGPAPEEAGAQMPFKAPRTETPLRQNLAEVNKHLWLILSMLALAAAMNYLITGHRMILGFYTFPTLFSAYYYGRRHATLTALTSFILVGTLVCVNPRLMAGEPRIGFLHGRWYDVTAWGGILILTAYGMGTLHERHRARLKDLAQTYRGIVLMLRQYISNDKYTENHSYRVSVYASTIAEHMKMKEERIEDIRAASLLHDIGKLDTCRDLLYKAARFTKAEYEHMKKHTDKGVKLLDPVQGPLHRIIPIILAHHERYDGTGYHADRADEIPLEARIIAVADAYDAMTSDRPYRKAMSPFDARDTIARASRTQFDPEVVQAFLEAFSRNEMEVPELIL